MPRCFFCREAFEFEGRGMRKDLCPRCRRDLHACVQCRFYDPGYHNRCREPRAEMVRDRDRANVCDYFELAPDRPAGSDPDEAKRRLEEMFKR
jgi:hypothetical protein